MTRIAYYQLDLVGLSGYFANNLTGNYYPATGNPAGYITSGALTGNYTTQGNIFNNSGQLLQLDNSGKIPTGLLYIGGGIIT